MTCSTAEKSSLILLGPLTGLLTYLVLRHGCYATSDSWAFWEGSVSLLEKGRYEYLGGQVMGLWSPFYALYLAFVQSILGISGRSVAVAVALLSVANIYVWQAYVGFLTRDGMGLSPRDLAIVRLGISACLACIIISNQFFPHTQSLLVLLLPAAIAVACMLVAERQFAKWLGWMTAYLALMVAMGLAHYSTLIYVLPGALMVLCNPHHRKVARVLLSISLGVLGMLLTWAAMKTWHSHGSLQRTHVINDVLSLHGLRTLLRIWGTGLYPPMETLQQLLSGPGCFFLPNNLAWISVPVTVIAAGWLGWLATRSLWAVATGREVPSHGRGFLPRSHACAIIYVFLAMVIVYIVYNCIHFDEPLQGRPLWGPILALVPIVLLFLRRKSAWLWVAGLVVLSALPAARTVTFAARGVVKDLRPEVGVRLEDNIIRPQYIITTDPRRLAPPLQARVVEPPDFPWINRHPNRQEWER